MQEWRSKCTLTKHTLFAILPLAMHPNMFMRRAFLSFSQYFKWWEEIILPLKCFLLLDKQFTVEAWTGNMVNWLSCLGGQLKRYYSKSCKEVLGLCPDSALCPTHPQIWCTIQPANHWLLEMVIMTAHLPDFSSSSFQNQFTNKPSLQNQFPLITNLTLSGYSINVPIVAWVTSLSPNPMLYIL